MNWENILKRSGERKKINMPLLREALQTATATLAEFTLSEISPIAKELYREYLIRDGVLNVNNAQTHAETIFKAGRQASFLGRVINSLGVHTPSKRRKILPSGMTETIYTRREE
ncbi:MAG: hypothetical protein ACO2Z3_06695 [Flavobacteriaceae bacterium]